MSTEQQVVRRFIATTVPPKVEKLVEKLDEFLYPDWLRNARVQVRGDLSHKAHTILMYWYQEASDWRTASADMQRNLLDDMPTVETMLHQEQTRLDREWKQKRPKWLDQLRRNPKALIPSDDLLRLDHEGVIEWNYFLKGWELKI